MKFKDPRSLTSEQEEQLAQLIKQSHIKVGDIVKWKDDGHNETTLSFYEKNHWQRRSVGNTIVKVVAIIPKNIIPRNANYKGLSITGICYVLEDNRNKRYFVRENGIKKCVESHLRAIIFNIERELNEN